MNLKVVLATIFFLLLISGGVFALLVVTKTIPYNGTIAAINVEVFNDIELTQICNSLNVGTVNPGAVATQTIYIHNSGTVAETLSMTVTNWNPALAGTLLTLTWDRENFVLGAGQSVKAILTLTVPANTGSLTTFSADVTIKGTG